MKLKNIILENLPLFEIGDTTKGYEWEEVFAGKKYTFSTPNYKYIVRAKRLGKEKLDVIFMVEFEDGKSLNKITDEGNPYKVVSTVVDIIRYI